MKTAIIGLPMTGKTSLFAILTGVHHETRMGSTAARTGVAKVPDARLEALGRLFEPPKVTHATVEYVDMPSVSRESLRDPAYVASLGVGVPLRAARVRRSTARHEKGSVDPLRDLEAMQILNHPQRPGGDRKTPRAASARQGSQEDQESGVG